MMSRVPSPPFSAGKISEIRQWHRGSINPDPLVPGRYKIISGSFSSQLANLMASRHHLKITVTVILSNTAQTVIEPPARQGRTPRHMLIRTEHARNSLEFLSTSAAEVSRYLRDLLQESYPRCLDRRTVEMLTPAIQGDAKAMSLFDSFMASRLAVEDHAKLGLFT